MFTPDAGERETWMEMPPSLRERIRQDREPDAARRFDRLLQRYMIDGSSMTHAEGKARWEVEGEFRKRLPKSLLVGGAR